MKPHDIPYNDEAIHLLYKDVLKSCNRHYANDFADLFAKDGNSIGFDGSQMNGQDTIRVQLLQISISTKCFLRWHCEGSVRFFSYRALTSGSGRHGPA